MNTRLITVGTVAIACLALGIGCQPEPVSSSSTSLSSSSSSLSSKKQGILRAGIPPKAVRVEEGSGQVVYVAEHPGRIFLYDASSDQVVEGYHIRRGQRFAVDASSGRATLDGNEVSVGKLARGATYQIYFLPENEGY